MTASARATPFTKMHGLGNDYLYVDVRATGFDVADAPAFARRTSPRRTSVGADGVILVAPSSVADCRMIMFNADGSRGRMCGNGARCTARFVRDRWGLPNPIRIETDAGVRVARVVEDDSGAVVTLDMGPPGLDAADVPCLAKGRVVEFPLDASGHGAPRVTCVSMGNPHAVVFVDDPETAPVTTLGAALSAHPFFPEGANVEFVAVRAPDRLALRVFERGSGETAACGTGACAALVAASLTGRASRRAHVSMPGGSAEVAWTSEGGVLLTGPAEYAFEGIYPAH